MAKQQVGVFYKSLIQGQACEIVYNVAQPSRGDMARNKCTASSS